MSPGIPISLWDFIWRLITIGIKLQYMDSASLTLLMAELIFLGRSFYFRMTLTYHISGPVGFSDSKTHTVTGPGIASILVVIRESNHAHFLTSFCSDKVNTLWHKKQP